MKNFKNSLKTLLVILILIPCLLIFSGCGKSKSTAESLANELGFNSVQEMIESFKGTDGKDAPQIDTYTLWQQAKEQGYDKDYLTFIKENITVANDSTSIAANKGVMSVVTVNIANRTTGGSGVIISINENEAYIITNYHVVYNPSSALKAYKDYKVSLYGMENSTTAATFVGGTANYDLAVLKVNDTSVLLKNGAKPAIFAENDVKFGSECLAIGNPRPDKVDGIAVSRGVVSVDYEQVSANVGGATRYFNAIRHDCYITNGSSGGGLFNLKGELIGITNGGVGGTSINYAIPSTTAKYIAEKIISTCDGTTQNNKIYIFNELFSTPIINQELKYNSQTGFIDITQTVIISGISNNLDYTNGSSKLNVGDTFISIKIGTNNEKQITRDFHITNELLSARVGDVITLKMKDVNTNEVKTVTITLTQNNLSICD